MVDVADGSGFGSRPWTSEPTTKTITRIAASATPPRTRLLRTKGVDGGAWFNGWAAGAPASTLGAGAFGRGAALWSQLQKGQVLAVASMLRLQSTHGFRWSLIS